MVDQILPTGDKVFPGVRLGEFLAGQVPIFAILPSPSDMRLGENAALVKPGLAGRIEIWLNTDPIRAIAVQECGMGTVHRQAFFVDNG